MSGAGTGRLDQRLVALGLASGRDKAKELILGGQVTVDGRVVKKPAAAVAESAAIACAAPPERYVGRGGYKLEKAIELAGWSLQGVTALDVGASTGGFTQCLLERGAARVFAVDVGHGQLHPALRADSRVVSLEDTDIRDREALARFLPGRSVDFCTVDVSFISLRAVLPAVLPYLKEGARLVCLIKPQFEAGRGALSKNGVVRDRADHRRVLRELCGDFAQWGLLQNGLTYSPLRGGEGNIEYLAWLTCRPGSLLPADEAAGLTADPDAVVAQAFANLP